jgi:hypothetical protein
MIVTASQCIQSTDHPANKPAVGVSRQEMVLISRHLRSRKGNWRSKTDMLRKKLFPTLTHRLPRANHNQLRAGGKQMWSAKTKPMLSGLPHRAIFMAQAAKHRRFHNAVGRALNAPEFALLRGDPRVNALRKRGAAGVVVQAPHRPYQTNKQPAAEPTKLLDQGP